MPHQPIEQDSINWSGQISAIPLLATTSQVVLVFIANFNNGAIFEQWVDIYDFNWEYLSSIELPFSKRPLFVDKDDNIWLLCRDKSQSKSDLNRTISIESWRLTT